MYTIGIDIGGMSIKFGLVDDFGQIIYQTRVKTARTSKECVADMVNCINEILSVNFAFVAYKIVLGVCTACNTLNSLCTGKSFFCGKFECFERTGAKC